MQDEIHCVRRNIFKCLVLYRFASICQSARMVPIVEPEILSSGEHSIDRALQVHEEMLSILFRALNKYHVYLEGMVLKPAMVLSGIKNTIKCTPQVSFNNILV